MTSSPITRIPAPQIFFPHKVAAAKHSKSDEAAAAAPVYHTGTKPKDRAELSPEERIVLKNILLSLLKAESKDDLNPLTLQFDAPSFLYHLRECLRNENTPSIKIFDTFLLIGSGVTSCINTKIKPSDLDFLIRREVLIDEATFDGIVDKKAYIKALLDHMRNQIEEVGLAVYHAHNPAKPLNERGFFQTYITKSRYQNEELKEGETRDNRWGMLHLGEKFEIKYEITISVVRGGRVVKKFAGLRAYYGIIAQDLFIILDLLLDTYDPDTQTFDFDACKFPIFSMDHLIPEVMEQIRANILSDDHIDGFKFLPILRKFTFTSGLIDPLFFQEEFKDFLRLVSLTDMKQQLYSQLTEKVATQKLGTIFCLLNISFLALRTNALNKTEIDTTLANIAKDFLKVDQAYYFYWDLCKILFLFGSKEKVSEDIIAISQYDETTYQLFLPPSFLEIFISFFKNWQKFNNEKPSCSLLKFAKEMFPQLRPGEFKNDQDFLYSIIKKMRSFLDTTEQAPFLNYLLFNHKELLDRGELKEKLISYGSYLPPLPEDIEQALLLYNIPNDLSPPSIEKIVSSILLTKDPELAKLGIKLLKSSVDTTSTIKHILQLSLQLIGDDNLLAMEFLSTLCPEGIQQELISFLKFKQEDIKEAIKKLAASSYPECKNLSLILFQRAITTRIVNEEEIQGLTQKLIILLKNSPELKGQLQKLFSSIKKPSFFLRTVALKLGILDFPLDKSIEELPKVNFTDFSEEQIIFIHETYCECILKLIGSCNRTDTKKLSDLFSYLPSIKTSSIHDEVCLKLTEKCSQFTDVVFKVFPILIREGYLINSEVTQLLKIIISELPRSETLRLFNLLKKSAYRPSQASDFDQIIEPILLKLLINEEEDFSQLFSELKEFIISEERKVHFFEQKLKAVFEQKNILLAQKLFDVLIEKEPSLIKQGSILENMLSLIHLFVGSSGTVLNVGLKATSIKQDVVINFRKTASYLAYLSSQGFLTDNHVQIHKDIILQWMCLPITEYTAKTAHHLFELFATFPIALKTSFLEIVNGLLRSKKASLFTLTENVAYSFYEKGILQGNELETTYGLLIHAFARDQKPVEAEALFYKAIKNKIFNTKTPSFIWLDSLAETLNALKGRLGKEEAMPPMKVAAARAGVTTMVPTQPLRLQKEAGEASQECSKKIENLIIFSLSHHCLKCHLLDPENYITPSRFEGIITQGLRSKACETYISDILVMVRLLFETYSASQVPKEFEKPLISALYAISISKYTFSLNELKLILNLVLGCKRNGLLKEMNIEKFHICSFVFESCSKNILFKLMEPLSTEEVPSVLSIVNELNFLMTLLVQSPCYLEKILNDSPSIISRFIAVLACSLQHDDFYFERALEIIRPILNFKTPKSKISPIGIRVADGMISGVYCFLEHNKQPPDFMLGYILELYEKNFPENRVLSDTRISAIFYNSMTNYIFVLAVLQKKELVIKALDFLDNTDSNDKKHVRDCYLQLLEKTAKLCDAEYLNNRLLESVPKRKFTVTEQQSSFIKSCMIQKGSTISLKKTPISSFLMLNEQSKSNLEYLEREFTPLFSGIKEFYALKNRSAHTTTIKELVDIHSKLILTTQTFYDTCLRIPESPPELHHFIRSLLTKLKSIGFYYEDPLCLVSEHSLLSIHSTLYHFLTYTSESFYPLRHRVLFSDFQLCNDSLEMNTVENLFKNILLGFKACLSKLK